MTDNKAHKIGNCPICNKPAEIVDYKKDIGKEFIICDGNEYYSCFFDKDYPNRRLVIREKNPIVNYPSLHPPKKDEN
jgi:hypothetical protein